MSAASPICEVSSTSLGGWTSTASGVDVAAGETVHVQLVSIAGVRQWSVAIVSADERCSLVGGSGYTVPTVHPGPHLTDGAAMTAPSPGAYGAALILRSTVLDVEGVYTSTTFEVHVPTSGGNRVGAVGEETECGQAGWLAKVNTAIRQSAASPSANAVTILGAPIAALPASPQFLGYDGVSDFGFAPPEDVVALGLASATAALDCNAKKVGNVADGVAASDVATVGQLDAVVSGLDPKPACRAVATSPITLSGTQTVDDVALTVGDRVLVTAQASGSANGIYVVASGAWTRAADAATGTLTQGAYTTIAQGGNTATEWVLTTVDPITVGSTAQVWSQIHAALASDAAHGTRGGGTIHAAATTSVAGFMSASDKSKLDEVASTTVTSATAASSTHFGTVKLSAAPASATVPIACGDNDSRLSDSRAASSVSESVLRTAAAGLSASLAVNSQKITGLANGSAATDAAAFGQLTTWTGYGTYANLPAAGTAGRLYVCSDGPGVVLVDTGSAWHVVSPYTSPLPLPPATGSWTWVSQGAATLTQVGPTLQLSTSTAAAGWRKITMAASAPYVVTTLIQPQILMGSDTPAHFYGIGWHDSVSAKSHILRIYRSVNTLTWAMTYYDGSDAFVADRVGPIAFAYWQQPFLVRLTDNNTNRIVDVSADGSTWETLYSNTRTTDLTPNRVMACVSLSAGTVPCTLSLRAWG